MNKDSKNNESNAWLIIGGIFAFLVICAWIANIFLLPSFIKDASVRGSFGDSFGAINALFSGLAFVGVIVAILLQKEELEAQRNELEETRKEFQEQNKTLKQQRFENTFFSMLSLHNDIVNSLIVKKHRENDYAQGREIFKEFIKYFRRAWDANQANPKDVNQIFTDTYNNIFSNITGHYFRNLYRIFVFISESDVDNKQHYAKIVRAQLSNHELVILFYNCYYHHRGLKFQKYTKTYDLFDNLNPNDLISASHLEILKSTK